MGQGLIARHEAVRGKHRDHLVIHIQCPIGGNDKDPAFMTNRGATLGSAQFHDNISPCDGSPDKPATQIRKRSCDNQIAQPLPILVITAIDGGK